MLLLLGPLSAFGSLWEDAGHEAAVGEGHVAVAGDDGVDGEVGCHVPHLGRGLAAGGEVTGVIPTGLASKEVAHSNLTALRVVRTMHERKAEMADLADAFLALPGGMGTFDELFEILTWAQLGIHRKPIGLLNIDRYFDPLVAMVDHTVREGFVSPHHRGLVIVANTVDDWFSRLAAYDPPAVSTRWIGMQEV
ncbi:MAG: TIGR00730 family Rossman fold protein [Acidobacteria bacterium]|nr:TIGR00730 family Rossman fold protein [Acidobacteriota bacterium]